MINVHKDDQVDSPDGKPRIGRGAEDGFDIAHSGPGGVLAQAHEHLRLDVIGVHLPGWAHALGQLDGNVTGARANLRNGSPLRDAERVKRTFDVFFRFAFGALQPVGAGRGHHAGDFPSRERVDCLIAD